jgi:hypothetical protein
MREYFLRRGHKKNIEGQKLAEMVRESFGEANEEGAKISASYGALDRILVWTDGKKLFVDTNMNANVSDEVAGQTIGAFNRFLEKATGYTAKERGKRAQKEAKKG